MVHGKLSPNHYIEIKKDKIIKISNRSLDKDIVDFSEYYLSPGLIDAHTHIFISQNISDGNFSNAIKRELKLSKNEREARAKKYLSQYIEEGFTSLFDLGNSGFFFDTDLRDAIRHNTNYPQLFVSGPGISSYPGQFASGISPSEAGKEYFLVDRKTDVSKMLDSYLEKKVDILKIYLDNYPGPGKMDEDILRKILSNSRISKFKKVTFHSFVPESAILLRKFKIKNTEHFNFYSQSDLPPDLSFITPTNFDIQTMKQFNQYSSSYYLLQQNTLKKLYKSRLKILFGPDFYFSDEKDIHFNRAKLVKRTLHSYIEAQFEPKEILKMMTFYPAQSLGMENKFGQISEGSLANLIATKENPLENISALFEISIVINKGKMIVLRSR